MQVNRENCEKLKRLVKSIAIILLNFDDQTDKSESSRLQEFIDDVKEVNKNAAC